jgi:hypothetical protein
VPQAFFAATPSLSPSHSPGLPIIRKVFWASRDGWHRPCVEEFDLLFVSCLKFVCNTARKKAGRGILSVLIFAAISIFIPNPAFASRSVILAWNPSAGPNIAGYNVYYGTASGVYTQIVPAGNATSVTISGLVGGVTYFFAVTAVDTAGLESLPSSQVSYTVPAASPVGLALAKIRVAGLPNVFSLTSTGVNPARWAIEASPDLKSWRTLFVGTDSSVHLAVLVSSAPAMFFRLRSGSPGVRLWSQYAQTNGFPHSFTLASTGATPQQWILDASTDLKTWSAFGTGSNSPVNAAVIVSPASSLFFRLKSL